MKKNTQADFEKKFVVTPSCWWWSGPKTPTGYGRFKGPYGDTAHRFSYGIYIGEIPVGMQVCHRCDNPSCVNPDHLFVGTNQQNVDDKIAKGRHPKGAESKTAKLSAEQVAEIRRAYIKGSKTAGTRALAAQFGMSHRQIWGIVANKFWIV